MMARLVVFGCSLAYGYGLVDCWDEKTNMPPKNSPSKLAWPKLVADALNMECVNLSKPASSNKEIEYTIMNTDILQNDFVIVQWSYNDRWCIIRDNNVTQLGIWQLEENPKNMKRLKIKEIAETYFGKVHSYKDMRVDANMRMSHVWHYLKSKNIKQSHFIVDQSFCQMPFNQANIDKRINFSILFNLYPLALDNSHPGPLAHAQHAKNILKFLGETNND
jgi:hypothetical protein